MGAHIFPNKLVQDIVARSLANLKIRQKSDRTSRNGVLQTWQSRQKNTVYFSVCYFKVDFTDESDTTLIKFEGI
jgi:hypothetical protein